MSILSRELEKEMGAALKKSISTKKNGEKEGKRQKRGGSSQDQGSPLWG